MRFPSNRTPLQLCTLACVLALAGCGGDDEPADPAAEQDAIKSDTVVFADYGGTTRTARTEAFLAPFSKSTGVRAVSADADPAKLELFADNEKADWDLIDMDGWDLVRFSEQGCSRSCPRRSRAWTSCPRSTSDYASGGYTRAPGSATGPTSRRAGVLGGLLRHRRSSRASGRCRTSPTSSRGRPARGRRRLRGPLSARLRPRLREARPIRDDLLFYDSFGQGVQYLAQGTVSMALLQPPDAVLKTRACRWTILERRVLLVDRHGSPEVRAARRRGLRAGDPGRARAAGRSSRA